MHVHPLASMEGIRRCPGGCALFFFSSTPALRYISLNCKPAVARLIMTLVRMLQNNCQDANIVSCTFTNNTAQQGPVLYLNNSVPNITGSTFNGSMSAANQVFDNSVTSPSAEGSADGTLTGGNAPSDAAGDDPSGSTDINVGT